VVAHPRATRVRRKARPAALEAVPAGLPAEERAASASH
jgi:hypothetical protein